MITDYPIPPEHLQRFRSITNRMLVAAAVIYLISLALIPVPSSPWLAFVCTLLAGCVLFAVSMLPWGWWRTVGLNRGHRPVLPSQYALRYAMSGALAGIALVMPLWAMDMNPPIPLMLAGPFLLTGVVLAFQAFFGREIGPPSCPKCAYEVAGLRFPTPCPECGHNLASPADVTVITRVRRPGRAGMGAALFTAGIAIATLVPLERSHLVALLPAQTRFALAHTDRDAFNTLDKDALSDIQRTQLIDSIIDHRRTIEPFRIMSQIDWLAEQLMSQRLTPEQSERFVTEGTSPQVITSGLAHVGQPLPLIFTLDTKQSRIGLITRLYFIRSLSLGDQTIVQSGTTPRVPEYILEPISSRFLPSFPIPPPRPFHTATPATPGPTRIRLDIIAITSDGNTTPTITWHADGSYTITPQPLTTHELTAETTIHIAP